MEIFKEKYYTPEIEEFHVGFEYEYLTNGDEWVKHIINNKADLIDCIEDIKESKIRVKYLDKEDIESLGFKHIENNYTSYYKINAPGKLGYWTEVAIDFRWGYDDISILGFRGTENDILFRGIIKNKSELKRLMKQLNIVE